MASGAIYFIASPVSATAALVAAAFWARTSATWPASLASMPKPRKVDAAISALLARSSPLEAARSSIPGMASMISLTSKPALARFSIPAAASDAENAVEAPRSLAVWRSFASSSSVAPEMAATRLIPESKSEVILTAAVPRAVTPADTGMRAFPTPETLSPTSFNFPPTSSILRRVVLVFAACSSRDFNFCSVSSISRWRPSYCSWVISPFWSCSLAWDAAVFKVSSLSLVSLMASPRRRCFCARSSVLVGSSFKSFSTSFSWDWVFLISLLTPDKADESFVVSPPISTVIPWILEAIGGHLRFRAQKPSCIRRGHSSTFSPNE